MLESQTENVLAAWAVDSCPFTIEYSPRVIDDIRLAVVDAFFSLPRGGAEIGGILLGRNEGRRVTITDYVPLDCEHAMGPSFVLSPNDHAKLAELLASARGNPLGTQPVGWYHSHTRSEIHLSAADIEIHRRYFPEPWQVALVLKPHTFQPTRAGFFFQESDGSIHAAASYQEFIPEPTATRVQPDPAATREATPAPLHRSLPEPPVPMMDATVVEAAAPPTRNGTSNSKTDAVAEPDPEAARIEIAPPAFTQAVQAPSRGGIRVVVALAAGLVLGAGYQARQVWLPRLMALGQGPRSTATHPAIGLTTLDAGGQLQIRWDRDSAAVRNAENASLVIEDGPVPQAILLDSPHLQTGSFTYGRQTERVDVTLTVREPSGQTVKEVSTYLGKLPGSPQPSEDPVVEKQRADEEKELRGRTKKLEKTVDDLKLELRQRKRLQNQSPDDAK